VDAWTFLWLMLFLKIPIVALFLIVRWAVRQTPETASPARTAASAPGPGRGIRTAPGGAHRGRRGEARTASPHRWLLRACAPSPPAPGCRAAEPGAAPRASVTHNRI